MKTTTKLNYETIKALLDQMLTFYNDTEQKITEIEGLINESIDTKG